MKLGRICRLCFIGRDSLTEATPEMLEMAEVGLNLKLRCLSGVKICGFCVKFLENVVNFKLMCQENEKQLVDMLHAQNAADEPAIKMEIPMDVVVADLPIQVIKSAPVKLPTYKKVEKPKLVNIKKRLFQCDQCGEEMKYHKFELHMRRHQSKFYECDLCGKKLTEKFSLRLHIEDIHLKIRTVFCPLCPQHEGFVSERFLRTHNTVHHGPKLVCIYCGAEKKTKGQLKTHIEGVHLNQSKEYPCSECHAVYKTRSGLALHIRTSHKTNGTHATFGKLNIACPCGPEFTSRVMWRNHLKDEHRTEDNKYKCVPPCTMGPYTDRDKLVAHFVRCHNVEYKTRAIFQTTKNEAGNYVCEVCGEEFLEMRFLSRHRTKKHPEVYRSENAIEYEKAGLIKKIDRRRKMH